MRLPRLLWIVLAAAGATLLVFLLARGGGIWSPGSDRAVRSFALGAWGLVVAAGLIGSGMRLSVFARNLALWLAAMVVLVAVYQYRYELQDVASRISAGLVPGSPISLTDADGRATVQLGRSPSGHFEARATLNGASVRFLIDTGATMTVLSADDAASAGYDLSALAFNIPVLTANGQTSAASVRAASLQLGRITREHLQVLVAAPGQLEQSLLGMNFIGSLSGFDMRGDRMILRD